MGRARAFLMVKAVSSGSAAFAKSIAKPFAPPPSMRLGALTSGVP